MLFNSIEFCLFYAIVFIAYWQIFNKEIRWRNLFLLAASSLFYGWWDWRFLGLIYCSILVDFFLGLLISYSSKEEKRKILLAISIGFNLGLLAIFKYYGFFVDSLIFAFRQIGVTLHAPTLQLILPVGISFYTFQTLSYTIDVYRKVIEPTKEFTAFAAYVSFFPQLVAGPIERAKNLLPQFFEKKNFELEKIKEGFTQMLWGFFKKLVIADNCAPHVNYIFENFSQLESSTLIVGVFLFSFQIYCDFSGYSDIAIGIGKTLGFRLRVNFAYPYFSRDLGEFWRRWHISLNTWFRDYLYIPLGGSRGSRFTVVRNIFLVFLISGLWHGANWNFIVWGGINALFFIPLVLSNNHRVFLDQVSMDRCFPTLKEGMQILFTFFLVSITWVFFRAASLGEAFDYIGRILGGNFFIRPELPINWVMTGCFILFLILVEWIGRKEEFPFLVLKNRSRILKWSCYSTLILLIGIFGRTETSAFIYFQF